jgi:hypothetical protein
MLLLVERSRRISGNNNGNASSSSNNIHTWGALDGKAHDDAKQRRNSSTHVNIITSL